MTTREGSAAPAAEAEGRIHGLPAPGEAGAGASVVVGSFDGVHLGHQRLLHDASAGARHRGRRCLAVTFDPHPRCVVDPSGCPPALTATDERVELLRTHGADLVAVVAFTPELSRLPAQAFCDELARSMPGLHLYAGVGFALGHDREGDLGFLHRYGVERGFEVHVVPPRVRGGAPVSSRRIRLELARGRVASARALLGRPYAISGVVERGERRGRRLGFPTANLRVGAGRCIPRAGIYAAWLRLRQEDLPAAVSIGVRPTFGGGALTVEAHVLDFQADLYGQEVALVFARRLRAERRYSDPESLVSQIRRDVGAVRRVLGGAGR